MARQNTTETNREQSGSVAKRESDTPSTLSVSSFSTSPFGLIGRLMEDIDQMFGDFGFGRGWSGGFFPERTFARAAWSPNIEVFERDDQLVVRADLPGLKKDDVQIHVDDDQLVIEGQRRYEHDEKKGGIYRSERSYGSFYRAIPLAGGVDTETVDATMHNGVLEVTLKLTEQRRAGRRIEIKEGKGEGAVH